MTKIVIDPGHGGTTFGAAANGIKEKDIVLDIAKRAKEKLLSRYICEVKLTRETDVSVSLANRCKLANDWGADVFVSIHANGFGTSSVHGFESFIYTSKSAGSVSLRKVIHPELSKLFRTNRGMKVANFYVLRNTKMPAILTENGFITNPQDAEELKKASVRDAIAEGHVIGLVNRHNIPEKPKAVVIESAKEANYQIVKSGESMWKLANDNKMTVAELAKINTHVDDPNVIHVGDLVFLSDPTEWQIKYAELNREYILKEDNSAEIEKLKKDLSEANNRVSAKQAEVNAAAADLKRILGIANKYL